MTFDVFGNSKLDAQGFQGASCADATKNYIKALAASDKDEKRKPEYSMPNPVGGKVNAAW